MITCLVQCINLFPNKPRFLRVCNKRLSKTLREMDKFLVTSNFKLVENGRKFSKQVDNTMGNEAIARNDQLHRFPQCLRAISLFATVFYTCFENCLPFSTNLKSSLANFFSVWKSVKFVIWERVKERN